MGKKWSYERMTTMGAIICQIQSIFGLAFGIFFLELLLNKTRDIPVFGNDRLFLNHLTKDVHTLILVLLFVSCIAHSAWFISSITVTCGNKRGNEKSLSQSLIITSIICLLDIILPFIMISTTTTVFNSAMERRYVELKEGDDNVAEIKTDNFGIYFFLLISFMRGGCLTFAINMFYLYVVYLRFIELKNIRNVVGPRFKSPQVMSRISDENFELGGPRPPQANYFNDSTLPLDSDEPREEIRLEQDMFLSTGRQN